MKKDKNKRNNIYNPISKLIKRRCSMSDINRNNVMSGIEININPRLKTNEVYYQKMTGTNGAIGEGNYQIVDSKLVTNRSLGGSVSVKQMKVLSSSTNNRAEADLGNSTQKIIIGSTNENINRFRFIKYK